MCERELGIKALDCKEILDLLKVIKLMKTVTDVGLCYEKLVKDIILNISSERNIEGRKEYRKVYVRGNFIKFSPSIINEYLGRSKFARTKKVPTIDRITKEITGGKVRLWPKKGLISSGSLSVKYFIMSRISAEN